MIVVDANVIVAGLRSNRGASHLLLKEMVTGRVAFALSVAVLLEYEDVLGREGILGDGSPLTQQDLQSVLNVLAARCARVRPWFRFRPVLKDPKDDLYLDCAMAADARTLVTFDRHFLTADLGAFQLHAATPREILRTLM